MFSLNSPYTWKHCWQEMPLWLIICRKPGWKKSWILNLSVSYSTLCSIICSLITQTAQFILCCKWLFNTCKQQLVANCWKRAAYSLLFSHFGYSLTISRLLFFQFLILNLEIWKDRNFYVLTQLWQSSKSLFV